MPEDKNTDAKSPGASGTSNSDLGGFFARCFKREELRDLNAHPITSLEEGINLLRVATRRFLDMSEPDIQGDWVKWLNAISLAGSRLGRLAQIRADLANGVDEDRQIIDEVLSEMMAELKLEKEKEARSGDSHGNNLPGEAGL